MKKNIFLLFILCLFVAKARAQFLADPCPPVSLCPSATTTNCLTVAASGLPGGTFSSGNAAIATVDAYGVITGEDIGTTTISYSATIPFFGSIIYRGDVTVLPPPSAAPSYAPVCDGGTLYLSANDEGGNTYSWSGPDAFTSTEQNPTLGSVSSAANGTYSLTITSPGGCVGNYTVAVTLGAYTVSVNQISPMLLSGDKVHTYWDSSFTLEAVTVPAVPATGVTYTWIGPEPSSSSLASFSPTFAPTFAPTAAVVNPYTVTVAFNGCSVEVPDTIIVYPGCSPYDYFSVNGYHTIKGLDSVAGCGDCNVIQPFHTITSTELTAANITDGAYYFVPQSVVCHKPSLTDNVFFMGDSTFITIDSATSVTVDHSHFFSCGWVGMIVNPGLSSTGHIRVINNTLIEDATVAMDSAYRPESGVNVDMLGAGVRVWPTAGSGGYYTSGMDDILESNGVIYNRNVLGINIYDYQPSFTDAPHNTRLPFTIRNSVFVMREFASGDTGTVSANNYPFAWPTTATLKTVTSMLEGIVPVYGLNAYKNLNVAANAIYAKNVGSSNMLTSGSIDNPATYEYNYLHIGIDSVDTDFDNTNLSDSFGIAYYLDHTNVKLYNNTLRNTFTSSVFNNYQYGDMQVAGNREDHTNNRFYNCAAGIRIGGSFPASAWDFTCRNADFIAVENVSGLRNGGNGMYALLDGGHNSHYIADNYVKSYVQGIVWSVLGGSYAVNQIEEKGKTYIRKNTIIGKTSSLDNDFSLSGILFGDGRASSTDTSNGSVYIDSNSVTGVSRGIAALGVKGQRVYIEDNNVTMFEYKVPYENQLYGIHCLNAPYLKTVTRNKITGVGYNCYGTNPGTSLPQKLSGIDIIGVGCSTNSSVISCNLVEDLNYGFYFHYDTSVLQWTNNEMRRCNIGLYMYYNAVIGTQGTASMPTDNRWTGDACVGTCSDCDDFPGWGAGTTSGIYTYFYTNAAASPIYIRTSATSEYVPMANTTSTSSTAYSFVTGSLIPSDDMSDGEPTICGPEYEARGVAAEETGKGVAKAYAGSMRLFPNPSEGSVTIAVTDAPDGAAQIRVVNTVGVEVYNGMHTFGGGATVLNLSNLPSGMYIIQLADSKGNVKTGRVLIEK